MAETFSFFEARTDVSISDLAENLGCDLPTGVDGNMPITSVAPIETAGKGSLTFIDNPKYAEALLETKATAVICAKKNLDKVPQGVIPLVCEAPYKAFAMAMGAMFPTALRPQPLAAAGISKGAFVDPSAKLEPNVTVEHGAFVGPHAVIGEGALVGANGIVGPNVQIGRNSTICPGTTVLNAIVGDGVILHSGVRVGGDGFGFAMGPGGHLKVPQIGRVVIQDNVEIGSNTCVDRGSNRDTIIGEGSKIDNLVMIGHNVVIGRHCVIVGQTGIAGSAELGDYVVLGGQVAVNGHIKIGMGAQLAGLSGVSGDVPAGVQWGGVPARPIKHWMRDIARSRREAFAMDKKGKGQADG